MLRTAQKTAILLVAIGFALCLYAYVFLHDLFIKGGSMFKLSQAEECKEVPTIEEQKNSNKMLFISCGGFFE